MMSAPTRLQLRSCRDLWKHVELDDRQSHRKMGPSQLHGVLWIIYFQCLRGKPLDPLRSKTWGFRLRSKRWLHVFGSPCSVNSLQTPADHSGTRWIRTLVSFEFLATWGCHIYLWSSSATIILKHSKAYPETKRTWIRCISEWRTLVTSAPFLDVENLCINTIVKHPCSLRSSIPLRWNHKLIRS